MPKGKTIIAAAAILIILIAVIGIFSDKRAHKNIQDTPTDTETETVYAFDIYDTDMVKKYLSEREIKIFNELKSLMINEQYAQAADCLVDNSGLLKTVYFDEKKRIAMTMMEIPLASEKKYLSETAGKHFVFYGYNKIYYGYTDENLKPSGKGMMLQSITAESSRYDYAYGEWNQGTLTGDGVCGYTYYSQENIPKIKEIKKAGRYDDNLLDGEFIYRSVNDEGKVSTWSIDASMGVTVLKKNWEYDDKKSQYQLFSIEDKSHAYAIPDTEIDEIKWKNQLTY